MPRRKSPKSPRAAAAGLVPRLRAAVAVLDAALERLARSAPAPRRRPARPKGPRH
jgi:hypothetical protein